MTASHNPKEDNGFKVGFPQLSHSEVVCPSLFACCQVYWDNGAQIIAPHDSGIATAIEENLDPWESDYLARIPSVADHELHNDVVGTVADAFVPLALRPSTLVPLLIGL